jgi:hypothetical protein
MHVEAAFATNRFSSSLMVHSIPALNRCCRFRQRFRQLMIDYDSAARCSLLILGFGYPAQDEFLREVRGRSLAGINKEIAQEQPDTAIRWWIVGIRESSRGQIAAYSRIVRLPTSVVSLTDERAGESVENARLVCARALNTYPDKVRSLPWPPMW